MTQPFVGEGVAVEITTAIRKSPVVSHIIGMNLGLPDVDVGKAIWPDYPRPVIGRKFPDCLSDTMIHVIVPAINNNKIITCQDGSNSLISCIEMRVRFPGIR